ncbi:MAG: hypothetical protein JXB10_08010 [Pirellulales bacterium]|nr:hypothetical protein [Pirellulales bacterium]
MNHSFRVVALVLPWCLVTISNMTSEVIAAEKRATLCTNGSASPIYDTQLRAMLDKHIPAEAKQMLTLTQCYGGDCVDNFSSASNTTVISATSPGQTAKYGGYDDDSADALRPGWWRDAADVHKAGTKGKHSTETPMTGGGLAPGDFPLRPTSSWIPGTPDSRHVVVYAGDPNNADAKMRDKISSSFSGGYNTTVTTVGGNGSSSGWGAPGTPKDLEAAIKAAGDAIRSSSNPANEQFLLYVTDHGDLHNVQTVTTSIPPTTSHTVSAYTTFTPADLNPAELSLPGFSLFVSGMTHVIDDLYEYTPYFQPGDWSISLTETTTHENIIFNDFQELFLDWDNDVVEPIPGEGLKLFFPCNPTIFGDSFFDTEWDVDIFNNTPDPYFLEEFSQDSGMVGKPPLPPALYWDVDPTPGIQGGNGTWSNAGVPTWNDDFEGANPLQTWDPGCHASFVAVEPSQVTIVDPVTVESLTISSPGCSFTGGSLEVSAGTIMAEFDVTIGSNLIGSNGLIKGGEGTLTLLEPAVVLGSTYVSNGTLALAGNGQLDTPMVETASEASLLLLAGNHELPQICGEGITEVASGASLTVGSIRQAQLIIGSLPTSGVAAGSPVPEPNSFLLAGMFFSAVIFYFLRSTRRS